jgi:hypothetical protein
MAALGTPREGTMKLTPAQIEEYQREGYFGKKKLFRGFVP